MKAIQMTSSIPRYLFTRALGALYRPAFWGPWAMLRYREVPEPELPGPQWVKIKTRYGGICGSDLRTILLEDSPMLSALVSFPFTLGHENVGVVAEVGTEVQGLAPGDRVVVEPPLPCTVRGIAEPCIYCQRGELSLCQNFAEGNLRPGLAIGSCADTGGSWSPYFVAHNSQVFRVPDQVSDENALMVEPFCVALRPVRRTLPPDDATVVVLGAGVVGLCVVAALRISGSHARVIAVAKYPFQAEMMRRLGADEIIEGRGDYVGAITRVIQGKLYKPMFGQDLLVGGADIVYECVGNNDTLANSLRLARSGGTVVLLGLAAKPKGVDWTPIWLHELTLRGSFWCSTETIQGRPVRAFQLALDWMAEGKLDLSTFITHRFRLDEYAQALITTLYRGRNGVIKSVFVFE